MTGIYVLVAIPMFILAANVMNDSGIGERLWGAASALVGRFRGGTATSPSCSASFSPP